MMDIKRPMSLFFFLKTCYDRDILGGLFMKKDVNKSDLITLALVYNYVANDKRKLKIKDVENFISMVEFSLFSKGIFLSDIKEDDVCFYRIDKEDNYALAGTCSISDICVSCIDEIPQDVFLDTLKQESLTMIGVERNKLRVVSVNERKNDDVELFSLGAGYASLNAVKKLEDCGCRNIMVNSVFFLGMKPDYLWRVSVIYDHDRYYLDLGNEEKVYGKRYEILH